jgi:hypothetical protein
MKNTIVSLFSLVLIAGLFVVGCGPEQPENDAFVTGTVTLDGEPVEDVSLIFQKADFSYTAFGTTDEEGVYHLRDATADGCQPGEYIVTIEKTETEVEGEYLPEDHPDYGKPGTEPKETIIHLLPEKYSDPTTSGLKRTVEPGENTIDFPLEK